MPRTWTESFDFYLAEMDDERVISILVDLAAAEHVPLLSHAKRVLIRCPLLDPRADGLRKESEIEQLSELEERLVEALGSVDGIYVGRTLGTGLAMFFFYAPAETDDEEIESLAEVARPYQPAVRTQRDPEWGDYLEFLFPNDYALHGIMNRRLRTVLGEAGDDGTAPRQISHEARFRDEEQARAAGVALASGGFSVDDVTRDGNWFVLGFHRTEPVADRIDATVIEILDIVRFHEGEYTGWGCDSVPSS